MESKAKLLGRPLHPMLIVFPMGLLIVSLFFDVLHAITGSAAWAQMAYYLIVLGVILGVVAAVPGVVDWMAIPRRTRARRVAAFHAIISVTVLVLFAITWGMRLTDPFAPETTAVLVSVLGVALLLVGAWLGGELVDRLGVGVDDGANLNAPNALFQRKVFETGPGSPRRTET